MPAYDRVADGLRTDIPIYVGATGPFMQKLADAPVTVCC